MNVRIIIDFEHTTPEFALEGMPYGAESMHAAPVLDRPTLYTVDNVPFFTHDVCYGDVVECGDHDVEAPDEIHQHWSGRVVRAVVSGDDVCRFTVAPVCDSDAEARDHLIELSRVLNGRWPDEITSEGGLGLLAIQAPHTMHDDVARAIDQMDHEYAFTSSVRTF